MRETIRRMSAKPVSLALALCLLSGCGNETATPPVAADASATPTAPAAPLTESQVREFVSQLDKAARSANDSVVAFMIADKARGSSTSDGVTATEMDKAGLIKELEAPNCMATAMATRSIEIASDAKSATLTLTGECGLSSRNGFVSRATARTIAIELVDGRPQVVDYAFKETTDR